MVTHCLAVDAMGGDHAPRMVVEGLQIAAVRYPDARFVLFGDTSQLTPLLAVNRRAAAVCAIRHADAVVGGDMKLAQALRLRGSSLRLAIDAVACGEAAGVVTAGNTGALLAIGKMVLKTLPGIDRPAIAAIGPSARGDIVMLDLGANLVCDARNLIEFAVMGDAFARAVLGLPHPTLGLLNVGSEEQKGGEALREAAEALRASHLAGQFRGFVEGHDIAAGTTDIVVSDGFSGNVALKTGEGALRLMADLLRQVFATDLASKVGYLLARPGLERLREWLDPRRYNGAVMLGLNGVAVKSHGGTDAEGFAHAVAVAMDMVVYRFGEQIAESLARMAPAPVLTQGRGRLMAVRAILAGMGAYLPRTAVTNDELALRVDTTDAWIRSRTGIGARRLAEADETCAMMATAAARQALDHAGADVAEVGAIILATSTPDQAFPATALRVQAALGIKQGFGFDLSAACSGFVYALSVADAMIRAGQVRGALVIGAEVFSRILDWTDRGTCVLFGDGAGAVFLRAAEGEEEAGRGILSTHLHADGALGDLLYVNGATGRGALPDTVVMNGREVFRHAVTKLAAAVEEALAANQLRASDVDWLVPHQANLRIIDAMGKRLGLPPEQVVVTVERHANTSAASIPLALAEACADGRIKRGQLVLMEALGGGLTWGSALVRM